MSQLLVRNLDPEIVRELKLRARKRGVSTEEEHRQILKSVLLESEEIKPKRTLFDAFRELGDIAPDFEFEQKRTRSNRPPLEF